MSHSQYLIIVLKLFALHGKTVQQCSFLGLFCCRDTWLRSLNHKESCSHKTLHSVFKEEN